MATSLLRVRPMNGADVPMVAALEARGFDAGWRSTDFQRELEQNPLARYLVAEESEGGKLTIVGFAGLWTMADQAHIVAITVDPGRRRGRLGSVLLLGLLALAETLGMTDATLEVRPSNEAAIALYRRFGFHVVGTRARYYDDGEDALLMTTEGFGSRRFRDLRERVRAALAEKFPGLEGSLLAPGRAG